MPPVYDPVNQRYNWVPGPGDDPNTAAMQARLLDPNATDEQKSAALYQIAQVTNNPQATAQRAATAPNLDPNALAAYGQGGPAPQGLQKGYAGIAPNSSQAAGSRLTPAQLSALQTIRAGMPSTATPYNRAGVASAAPPSPWSQSSADSPPYASAIPTMPGGQPQYGADSGRGVYNPMNQASDMSSPYAPSGLQQLSTTGDQSPPWSPSTPQSSSGPYVPPQVQWTGKGVGQLTLDGPNGQTQVVDAGDYQKIDSLTRSGWSPIDGSGQPYRTMDWKGGQVFVGADGTPKTLNMLLGSQPTAEQTAEMQSPEFTAAVSQLPAPTPRQTPAPAPTGAPTGTSTPDGSTPPSGAAPDDYQSLFGLDGMANVPDINLGAMPMNRGGWAPEFTGNYYGMAENVRSRLNDIYSGTTIDPAVSAQMDLGGVPQPQNTNVASNSGLDFLLQGKGFDPATLARLHSASNDVIAQQGRSQQGQARLMAQQAGQDQGGAAMAMQGQIARQQGDAQTNAGNQIEIQNATQGLENLRQGAGMELQRGTTNAANANMMALQNASNMLSAMSQNVANMQQTNQTNYTGQKDLKMANANAQAGYFAGAGANYDAASTAKAANADSQNAANQYNWNLNQANLNRDAANTNAGIRENRWGTGVNGLISLTNATAPANYYGQGSALTAARGTNTAIPAALTNAGIGLLTPNGRT